MVETKVLIGVSTGEYARRADFYDYSNLLERPKNTLSLLSHDRSPARNRNLIIDAAIENNCTHVLLVDDDVAFKANALNQLLEHDVDIVTGLILRRSYPHPPLAFDLASEDGSAFPMYLMGNEPRLVPIVAAGFGFLLIRTSIFPKLHKPYVRMGELNPEEWCDDIGFFKRIREAEIQSFVDMEVLIGHIGTMIIWPNKDKDGKWMTAYDTNGTGAVNTPQFVAPTYEFKS